MIARRLDWLLMVLLTLALPGASRSHVQPPVQIDPIDPDRHALYCGVQAVCLISHLYGRPVDFERALAQIPVTGHGSSLAAMKRCLLTRGLDFETVRARAGFLDKVTDPFIAHLRPNDSSGSGHYVVVLAADAGELLMVDPSSRVYAVTNTATFSTRWSGYALVPRPSVLPSWRHPALLVAICALVATGLVFLFDLAKQARRNNASTGALALAIFFAIASSGCSGKVPSPQVVNQKLQIVGASTVDLGMILPSGQNQHNFGLRNVSNGHLDLRVGDISCGCARADLDTNRVGPGQSTAIRLAMRGGRPGPKNASATIFSTAENGHTDATVVQVQAVFGGVEVKPEVLRIALSGSPSTLRGQGVLELYTDDANDMKLLRFTDLSKEGLVVPLHCDFGDPQVHVMQDGTHLSVPMSLTLQWTGSAPPPAHYRHCRLSVGESAKKFQLKFLVWVDSPPDYRVLPAGLVVRVRPQADGNAAGTATLRVEGREGVPPIDSLTVTCDLAWIATEVSGTNIEVKYVGPPLKEPLSTALVLSSPRFGKGHEQVPLLVLRSR